MHKLFFVNSSHPRGVPKCGLCTVYRFVAFIFFLVTTNHVAKYLESAKSKQYVRTRDRDGEQVRGPDGTSRQESTIQMHKQSGDSETVDDMLWLRVDFYL